MQFLESYKSVTLQSMADAFGISVDFIDEEVAEFIVDGRLPAKIDRVAGVIETKRSLSSNSPTGRSIRDAPIFVHLEQAL